MRVLIVGLGDIASKAYLPVLSGFSDLELHLTTRRLEVLEEVSARFRVANPHRTLDEALETTSFDAAFVHASTAAHPALVERLLLKDIPVMVDKPLADNLDDAARLIDLAERRNRLLAVGFNRRFAPDHAALRKKPRSMLLMQKHRRAQAAPIRQTVFDDFIHVVDTLRYLAPAPIEHEGVETLVRGGLLEAITLTLRGEGFNALGIMHRASGLDEESLDVLGENTKHSVLNLSETIAYAGDERRRRRGDWTSVGRQRGFEAMCAHFLECVRANLATAADDLLQTHRLCEMIVRQAELRAAS